MCQWGWGLISLLSRNLAYKVCSWQLWHTDIGSVVSEIHVWLGVLTIA